MEATSLETRMRELEALDDPRVAGGGHVVARLDGRGFTRLTKNVLDLDRPFDVRFRDAMLDAAEELMRTGPRVAYAYVQSDEISLWLGAAEDAFGGRLSKICSIFAGVASATFALRFATTVAFDCRVVRLPTDADLCDYFAWRQIDAQRNALGAHCYWGLRARGATSDEATARLVGVDTPERRELLRELGLELDARPLWERRGVGLSYVSYQKRGVDPRTGTETLAQRQRIERNFELPAGDDYSAYVASQLAGRSAA
jgi:tRNA(His) guanylyltransferase